MPRATATIGAPALSRSPAAARMQATNEELPLHFHIIVANISRIIAEKTSAGAVSGLFHSTFRMLSCRSVRIVLQLLPRH